MYCTICNKPSRCKKDLEGREFEFCDACGKLDHASMLAEAHIHRGQNAATLEKLQTELDQKLADLALQPEYVRLKEIVDETNRAESALSDKIQARETVLKAAMLAEPAKEALHSSFKYNRTSQYRNGKLTNIEPSLLAGIEKSANMKLMGVEGTEDLCRATYHYLVENDAELMTLRDKKSNLETRPRWEANHSLVAMREAVKNIYDEKMRPFQINQYERERLEASLLVLQNRKSEIKNDYSRRDALRNRRESYRAKTIRDQELLAMLAEIVKGRLKNNSSH